MCAGVSSARAHSEMEESNLEKGVSGRTKDRDGRLFRDGDRYYIVDSVTGPVLRLGSRWGPVLIRELIVPGGQARGGCGVQFNERKT